MPVQVSWSCSRLSSHKTHEMGYHIIISLSRRVIVDQKLPWTYVHECRNHYPDKRILITEVHQLSFYERTQLRISSSFKVTKKNLPLDKPEEESWQQPWMPPYLRQLFPHQDIGTFTEEVRYVLNSHRNRTTSQLEVNCSRCNTMFRYFVSEKSHQIHCVLRFRVAKLNSTTWPYFTNHEVVLNNDLLRSELMIPFSAT